MTSIGAIVGGAFRLIRERPGAVAMWGVAYLVGIIVVGLVVGVLAMLTGAGHSADGVMPGMVLEVLLLYLGYFLLIAVLMNAAFRAILRPADQRFFSLRLGGDEWRTLGLMLLMLVCSIVFTIIAELILMLLALVVALAAGGSGLAAGVGGFLLVLAFIGGFIWVAVRASLIFPLTFYRRAITLDEAWSLTRGRFWPLFASYLVVAVMLCVVMGTLFWFSFGASFGDMAAAGRDPLSQKAAMDAAWERFMAIPLAVRLLTGLLWLVVSAIGSALWHGTVASATRELLLEQGEVLGEDAESTAAIFE